MKSHGIHAPVAIEDSDSDSSIIERTDQFGTGTPARYYNLGKAEGLWRQGRTFQSVFNKGLSKRARLKSMSLSPRKMLTIIAMYSSQCVSKRKLVPQIREGM